MVIRDKTVAVDNLQSDLTAKNKECGDLKESNRIL